MILSCRAALVGSQRGNKAICFLVSCALVGAVLLTGCSANGGLGLTGDGFTQSSSALDKRSDLEIAQDSFERGAYGLSEKHFRLAIERDRDSGEAWLGLAACYDQIGRYDLADRAYSRVRALLGDDPIVLNNQAYSRILRGDYARAEALLRRARRKAPGDEKILENIELLNKKRIASRK